VLAIRAIAEWRFKTALGWMALAVAIDAVDGFLARKARARQALPWIDGALLDNLVDYLTYVIVPAYLLSEAALLPAGLDLLGTAMICVGSAFQFARVDAKTESHHFTGFPSYWNLVVFYLLLLEWPPWVALAVVVTLTVLLFVPFRYVYPSRTREYRLPTAILTVLWTLALVVMLMRFPERNVWLIYGSLLYVVYYAAVSIAVTTRWRRASPSP
jgi:phosphatidylcholine synthase